MRITCGVRAACLGPTRPDCAAAGWAGPGLWYVRILISAKRLKVVNDLILLSFCKAEKQNDESLEISNTEDFLEDLRLNWGRYLKRYVKDYKD